MMKQATALGIVLGLLVAVQALSTKPSPYGLLQLEGAVALEDLPADSSISIASIDSSLGTVAKKGHHKSKGHKNQDHEDKSHSDHHKNPPHYDNDSPPSESHYDQHQPYDSDSHHSYEAHHPYDSYNHDHFHKGYPPHDPYHQGPYDSHPHDSYYSTYDDPYWDPRYHAKAKLIACLKDAVGLFNREDVSTWQYAGKAVAHCLREFIHGCSGVPGLDLELTSTLPFALFVNALELLVDDRGSRQAAAAVLEFYLISGRPENEALYLGDDSCPAKLVALLESGARFSRNTVVMNSLSKVVIHMMSDSYKLSSFLEPCKADIPAVLLALISTQCPSTNRLYNAFDPTKPIPCKYNEDALYEDSAGALLGASIISGLLLSKNPKLMHFGFQLAFNINLLALAGTYTSTYANCPGEFRTFLTLFPKYSGPLGSTGMEVQGIATLSGAAKRVLCASIAAVEGGPTFSADEGEGNGENVLWQGAADVYNAIFKTIQKLQEDTTPDDPYDSYYYSSHPKPSITQQEIIGLCAVAKAVYSFDANGPSNAGGIVVTVPATTVTGERSAPCYTSNELVLGTGNPNIPPVKNFEGLKTDHTLNKAGNSAAAEVCGWDAPVNC